MVVFMLLILLPIVSATNGIGNFQPGGPELTPHSIYRPLSTTNPGVPPFAPSDLWKAYNFLPLYSRGIKGNGTAIAIIDAFGNPSILSDLASFDSLTGLPPATVNQYFPLGVPKFRNTGWAVETSLDVEWAHAIAPAATIDLVIAPDSKLGSLFGAISFVASSLPSEVAVSMSFGLSESLYPTTGSFTISATHQLFATIVSHGTTPVASSGDSGASSCCNIQYPSSDPLVLAVGGTSLTLNSTASYVAESAWTGSTAGASIVFTKPSYQQGLGDSMRDTVDVSYDADPNSGVLVVEGGSLFQVGGTSAGAPQWAALIALTNQANGQKYGSVSDKLYKISNYHDVISGSDGFFSATKGWDYPTGLGTPNADGLTSALALNILVNINSGVLFQGLQVGTAGSISVNPVVHNFTGTVTVTATNATTGIVVFSKTYNLLNISLMNQTSSFRAAFLLNIAVLPYPLSSDITVTLAGTTASAPVQVTRQIDIDGNGTVDISDASVVGNAWNTSIGSPNYNPRADLNASGKVDIVDVSIFGAYWRSTNFR